MFETIAALRERFQRMLGHRLFVPTCLVLGIVLRLGWILGVDADQVSDYSWYYQRAISIATGGGYTVDGVATGYWPIGYPGFLGVLSYLLGSSTLVGKLANVVLYVGTILLTYNLSKRHFHSESAARITLCILCFYPNHIAYTALLSSEILFIFLVAISVCLFDTANGRIGLTLLCGLSWGLTSLTKPQAVMLPVIALLMCVTTMRGFLKSSIVIYAVLITTVSPWMVRNYHVMGAATLANTTGINLLDGNNPYANGVHNFTPDVNELLGDLKMAFVEYPFDGKEVARDARARDVGVDYIIHHPGHVIALLPKKLMGLFQSDTEGIYYSLGMMKRPGGEHRREVLSARAAAEVYYALMIVLCFVALPTILANKDRRQLLGLAIIVYLTMVYLVFFGNSRYHFAMMPWVAIYSGIGGWRWLYGKEALSYTPDGKVLGPERVVSG